jgi:CBS domain-containing protein
MQVKDIMTIAPVCCTSDMPLEEVARRMVEHHCGCIPVVRDDISRHLVGVITDRDIVCRAVAQGVNPLDLTAGDCMSQPPVTIRPDASIDACCEALERHLVRRLPVIDEQGNCVGIVSQADIARAATQARTAELLRKVSQPTEVPARIQ